MRTHSRRLVAWAACLGGLGIAAVPRSAEGQCSAGTQVSDTCGDVSFEGCCLPDDTLEWCEGGVLCGIVCSQNPAPDNRCGWSTDAGLYDCGSSTLPDPTCAHPYDCPGNCVPCGDVSYEGCCEGLLVTWCECGCLRTIDCSLNTAPADTCGWNAEAGFYDCGQVGADPSGTYPLECSGGPCVPSCGGKQCGDDGCGGSCGTCPAGYVCNASGLCEVGTCTPDCTGKKCGDDGCGGSCGTCPAGQACNATGQCVPVCTPDCAGKQCGDDGCGGSCGTCPSGQTCDASGTCVSGGGTYPEACLGLSEPSASACLPGLSYQGCCDSQGRAVWCDGGQLYCLDCSGNGLSCGWSADGGFYDCDQVGPDPSGQHPIACDGSCTPSCVGKECGPDGCGSTCGSCPAGQSCDASGRCVGCTPACAGKQCGSDGCGGTCGSCPAGQTCDASSRCVATCIPDCAGKQCGDDGCGGTCGSCAHGFFCQSGTCIEVQPCTPDCAGKECGPDGCDGSCGVCPPPLECSDAGQCYDPSVCSPSCAGKECGTDGCGGSCGTCPPGVPCNASGRCEAAGLPDASSDAVSPGESDAGGPPDGTGGWDPAAGCPPGYVWYYGKCQTASSGGDEPSGGTSGGGCVASPQAAPTPLWWTAMAALGLAAFGRRRGPPGS